ncbi:MAG: response regulator transcription factor [Jejuia sp.]
MRLFFVILFITSITNPVFAQYNFNGFVDTERWQGDVYLSVIDDYRTLANINNEQIISKTSADANGYFEFTGNEIENSNKIYKIHVDNCTSENMESNHFDGHCADSKEILFIAKNSDTISFPLSFDAEMFCDIKASNVKASTFIRIDSLIGEMRFDYAEFRSKANRDLNNKKWFKTLQDFGEQLDEPLAELYIYAFLSERGSPLHQYYLADLTSNKYYNDVLERLNEKYPNSPYTRQYQSEIEADIYSITPREATSSFNWIYALIILLLVSVVVNFWFIKKHRAKKNSKSKTNKEQLTKQEQKVLDLILEERTNKEIAEALFVSLSTVKTHVNNLYKKLNVNSRDNLKSLFNK